MKLLIDHKLLRSLEKASDLIKVKNAKKRLLDGNYPSEDYEVDLPHDFRDESMGDASAYYCWEASHDSGE